MLFVPFKIDILIPLIPVAYQEEYSRCISLKLQRIIFMCIGIFSLFLFSYLYVPCVHKNLAYINFKHVPLKNFIFDISNRLRELFGVIELEYL